MKRRITRPGPLYCCEAFAIASDLPEPDSPCSTSGWRSGPRTVVCDCVQHLRAPGEDAAAILGDAVVRFHFQIQRRAVLEALDLRLDHLADVAEDGVTQASQAPRVELHDVAGEARAQICLQVLQPRIGSAGWPPEKSEDMPPVCLGLAEARQNFLVRGRRFIFHEICFPDFSRPRGTCEGLAQRLFYRIPGWRSDRDTCPGLQAVLGRDGVLVQPVPL